MRKNPDKLFWWVVGLHLALLGGLLIAPLFHRRPKETVHFVDFVSEPAPVSPEISTPAPDPQPAPKPEPQPVQPEPKPTPIPEKPKWKPAKVVRQDRPVTKTITPDKTPTRPSPNVNDLKKVLSGSIDPFSAYDQTVLARFYAVWQQPASAPVGCSASAVIRIESDGQISSKTISRRSGNSIFDQSVQAALNAVARLPKPPEGFRKSTTIDFVLN